MTTTGGSLGLRSASYGSLQQQQYVQQQTTLLPIHVSPVVVRKPAKMFLSGSREKEKILPRIFKYAGRRSFGMSILAVICLLVCLSVLFGIFRDNVASDGVDPSPSTLVLPNSSISISDPENFLSKGGEQDKEIIEDQNKDNSSIFLNITKVSPQEIVKSVFPLGHPCSNFSNPPPPRHSKRTGPRPCAVCYIPVEQAILLMPSVSSMSPVLKNLTYVHEENPVRVEPFGGSDFGGYPSLKQRNDSFDIKDSMTVHCGFVRGSKPGRHTGFDIDDTDLFEMEQCSGIVVASAIFGNYDILQQPKNISEAAKKNVCFYMFVDEDTEAYMKNSSVLDERKKVGLWRVVVIHNLPYADARRNGKVPKLLLHRIFPNVRYSIWVDGKLELVMDPYQILERFLWRSGASFAISRHYRRFDVFEEAEANKAAGKYENASIDSQVEFYMREGLTPYSEAKLPITSDVPEGCVIIKEHIPITNLFTCLWFNEVDRFTSRDQISFSTVRDKIMSKVNWSVNMFWDCERRNFVNQVYHRDLWLEKKAQMAPLVTAAIHPPPVLTINEQRPQRSSTGYATQGAAKSPPKRGRERRSSSRHRRRNSAGNKETNSI